MRRCSPVTTLELPKNTVDAFLPSGRGAGVGWGSSTGVRTFGPVDLGQFELVTQVPLALIVSTSTGFEAVAVECELLGAVSGPRRFAIAFHREVLDVVITAGEDAGIHWKLRPGGSSVTARAEALRLIHTLAGEGQLRVHLGPPAPELPGSIYKDRQPLDAELEFEHSIFEALATLEEWTGRTLPMPETLNADQIEMLLTASRAAQTQRLHVTLRDLTLRQPAAAERFGSGSVDVVQKFTLSVGGVELDMGTGRSRLRLHEVSRRILSAEEAEIVLAIDEDQSTFVLSPPPSRRLPARRTQLPEPAKPQDSANIAERLLRELGVAPSEAQLTRADLPGSGPADTSTRASDALIRLRSERLA